MLYRLQRFFPPVSACAFREAKATVQAGIGLLLLLAVLPLASCRILPFEVTFKDNYWEQLTAPLSGDSPTTTSAEADSGSSAPESSRIALAKKQPSTDSISSEGDSAAPEGMEEIPSLEDGASEAMPEQFESSEEVATDGSGNGAIELVWKVPPVPVDGFVVKFGTDRQALDKELKVAVGQLEQYEDGTHGRVFRYLLQGVPQDRVVFVAISAYTGTSISEASSVFEVRP